MTAPIWALVPLPCKSLQRGREIKAAAPSGAAAREAHVTRSTALQDLGPISSLSGIESSLQPGSVWLAEECALVFVSVECETVYP